MFYRLFFMKKKRIILFKKVKQQPQHNMGLIQLINVIFHFIILTLEHYNSFGMLICNTQVNVFVCKFR